jgi:hypothetical protein
MKEGEDECIGCIITTERILILNENLKCTKVIKLSPGINYNLITSGFWFGKTLLYTTHNHIKYATSDGDEGTLLHIQQNMFICGASADRIYLGTYNSTKNSFFVRKILINFLDSCKTNYDAGMFTFGVFNKQFSRY